MDSTTIVYWLKQQMKVQVERQPLMFIPVDEWPDPNNDDELPIRREIKTLQQVDNRIKQAIANGVSETEITIIRNITRGLPVRDAWLCWMKMLDKAEDEILQGGNT
jgi:hypothetical protein